MSTTSASIEISFLLEDIITITSDFLLLKLNFSKDMENTHICNWILIKLSDSLDIYIYKQVRLQCLVQDSLSKDILVNEYFCYKGKDLA